MIAISGPISVLTNKHTEKNGYRISLVIDTSLSMNALDFSKNKNDLTTRLDVIKNVIAKFIKNKNNDFFSLITFGDFPVLQSPLTADKNAIIQYLNNSYVGEFGNSTAMGDALGLAINSLNEFNKSRVIILLTDGANSSGEFLPETIAYIAKEKNIPIYTIGIGKEDKVPLLISNNRITYEFLPLDEKSLKQIAEISNGKYFKVTDINDLKKVYSEISKLTKVKLKSYDNVEIKYHHKELLILAFMMLIIAHFFKLIFVFRI
ncbi:MAG: VWA domain-containing protein [Rickettsiales bacterium]|nr:VWA domain-containing protein [Rickettsiales bacterium]